MSSFQEQPYLDCFRTRAYDPCGAKLFYPSRARAEEDAIRLRRLATARPMAPYLCPKCHGWHLATTND